MIPAFASFQERFGADLQDIAGAKAQGEIPLSDALVNRLIADRLRENPHVAAVRLEAQQGDSLTAHITPRSRLVPPLRIAARIERQPEFPHHPVLLLRWAIPAIGPLSVLAGKVLSFFKGLPPGISAEGDTIAVDLRSMLESRGSGELVRFIRRLAIHTRPGGFIVTFEVGTP